MYRGGAEHLARIHGTEEDKVNCPFYFKIGACRHGDKCSRQHHKPQFSQTLIIPHMWANPMVTGTNNNPSLSSADRAKVQEDFNDFYYEIFEEFSKFGKVEELNVCENLGDHLVGNVYVMFEDEEFAQEALNSLSGRYYAGRKLKCEYSPVSDFRESRCRQYDDGTCDRGAYCNFMHIREPSKDVYKHLETTRKFDGGKSRRRSPSRERRRDRSRGRRDGSRDRRDSSRGRR